MIFRQVSMLSCLSSTLYFLAGTGSYVQHDLLFASLGHENAGCSIKTVEIVACSVVGYLAHSVGLWVGGESSLWKGVFLFSYSLDLISFLVWEYCGYQELRCMDLSWHSRLCLGGSLLFSLLIPLYHWLCCSRESSFFVQSPNRL